MANEKKNKYILVAEDDKFYAGIYESKLAAEGYEVHVARDGDELLKALEEKIPDLILLDLIMPTMNGFDALEKIKANPATTEVNVIVMSNLSQAEDIEKAKQLGAVEYMVKADITVKDMLALIEKYTS